MNVYRIVFEVLCDDTQEVKQRQFHHAGLNFETVYQWAISEQNLDKGIGETLELILIEKVIAGLFTCPKLGEK